MKIKILKIIFNLFFLSSLFILSVFAQNKKVYNFSIKDETGEEIGQYFDIKIDSIHITADTTLNFQLIPNIEIQDSVLKHKYSTFLEMLIRNTNAENEKLWKDFTFNFGSYKYEGLDYDDRFRTIGNEINSLTAMNIINETGNAAISVNYSSRDNSNNVILNYDSTGNPGHVILHKKNYALNSEELSRDIRLAYLKTLFLNNKVDENLLDTDGNFTTDAINLIKILASLNKEAELNVFMNEENLYPVAIAKVDSDTFSVGEIIEIDGSDSFDPDGSIVSFSLKQLHMESTTLEYMTEWDYSMLQDLGDGQFRVKADKSGTYWNELCVSDAKGLTHSYMFPITVKRDSPSGLEYKVMNLMDVTTDDFSGLEETTIDRVKNGSGANHVEFVHNFYYTQVDPLPKIERLIGDPPWEVTDQSMNNFCNYSGHVRSLK